MVRMAEADSSRDSTTLVIPRSAQAFTPSRSWTVIWVEAWRATSGQVSRRSLATPRSWTRMASTPARAAWAAVSAAWGSSRSVTRVFRVR